MDQINTRELKIKAIIDRIDLNELSWNDEGWPEEVELGLLQLESRSLRLQGKVLEVFLTEYVKTFSPEISEQEMLEHFDVIFDEKTVSLTRVVLRNHLQKQPALSLNELTANVMDKSKPGFRKAANRLIKDVQDAVEFTGLWKIEISVRSDGQIAGYKISAGPALIDWEYHIWRPLRSQQIKLFQKNYGENL